MSIEGEHMENDTIGCFGELVLWLVLTLTHNRIKGGKFFKESVAPRQWGVLQDDLVLFFAERNISPWRRGNPLNFSFLSSSRLQIFIVNSADKTKLLSLIDSQVSQA